MTKTVTDEQIEELLAELDYDHANGIDRVRSWLSTLSDEPRADERAVDVLRAERDGARAQRDWYVKLLTRFWKITPPDFKTPDGKTMQFIDPDPHRSLRIIRDAMDEAQRQIESEQSALKSTGEPRE